MGRRSINTTKSGKYMNPTDQARKEARKRELKKNKKQRQMVRAAVLKGKDPVQIIGDMEKIDEMEYSVISPPLLNEKVLKDKRKKLKETWDRVMRLYSKEDRERYVELRKLEIEYENRRSTLMKYFESVRVTQQVIVDDIPLPAAPDAPLFITAQIPLPNEFEMQELDHYQAPHSILKKSSLFGYQSIRDECTEALCPPGVPAGPPPVLSSEEEDSNDEGVPMEEDKEEVKTKEKKKRKTRKIRFADESAEESKIAEDKSSSDDDDEEDDDTDEQEKDDTDDENDGEENTETSKHKAKSGSQEDDVDKDEDDDEEIEQPKKVQATIDTDASSKSVKTEDIPVPPVNLVPLPAGPPPGLPQGPPPLVFRPPPPPLRPGIPPPPRLLPPGVPPPPPGRPTFPPPGLPLRLGAPPIRLPPGPPPGIPPLRLIRPPPSVPPPRLPPPGITSIPLPGQPAVPALVAAATSVLNATVPPAVTVLSAPPSLMQRPKNAPTEDETQRSATIEAKPQIRNLSADVMRFMPTTLRVKREDRHKKGTSKGGTTYETSKEAYPATAPVSNPSASAPTKDDAYQQFLREMEEFL